MELAKGAPCLAHWDKMLCTELLLLFCSLRVPGMEQGRAAAQTTPELLHGSVQSSFPCVSSQRWSGVSRGARRALVLGEAATACSHPLAACSAEKLQGT